MRYLFLGGMVIKLKRQIMSFTRSRCEICIGIMNRITVRYKVIFFVPGNVCIVHIANTPEVGVPTHSIIRNYRVA